MKNCKNFFKAAVLSMLLVLCFPVIASAANYYVTTTTVNLRAKAGTQYERVLELPKECVVDVKSKANKNWYRVEYKNNAQQVFRGYIYSKYLAKADVYKTTCNLYMRKSPSGTAVVKIPKGSDVIVVNTYTGLWYKSVYFNKKNKVYRGYTYQDHLTKKGAKKGTYVTTDSVYMHTEPNITSASVIVVPKGKKVTVVNIKHGKWYQAKYRVNGKTYIGYISNLILRPL